MRAGLLVVLTLLVVGAGLALLGSQARAGGGGDFEGGGQNQIQYVAAIESPADVAQSGNPLPFRVTIVDQFSRPIVGMAVTPRAEGAVVAPATQATDEHGVARFTFTATVSEQTEFTIVVDVASPGAIADHEEFAVVAIPPPPQRSLLTRPETVSAGIGVAAILAALATTELGKVGLFNVVIFPLYSRLKREEVLDHFVRGQIYGYIAAHPGEHYNSLKEALKVTNGTLAHHLRTLEVQGFIKADRDGIYKRFYPVEMQIPRDKGIRLSDLQHHILAAIRGDGGPTQQDIADRLGVSQQTVSYNLRALNREGLVRMEKEGRARRYFPPDT